MPRSRAECGAVFRSSGEETARPVGVPASVPAERAAGPFVGGEGGAVPTPDTPPPAVGASPSARAARGLFKGRSAGASSPRQKSDRSSHVSGCSEASRYRRIRAMVAALPPVALIA